MTTTSQEPIRLHDFVTELHHLLSSTGSANIPLSLVQLNLQEYVKGYIKIDFPSEIKYFFFTSVDKLTEKTTEYGEQKIRVLSVQYSCVP